MNTFDILILLAIAAAAVFGLLRTRKRKRAGKGCCSSCCGTGCSTCSLCRQKPGNPG